MEGFLVALLSVNATVVLGVFALALLMSSYVPRWWMTMRYKRLPPGPFCWPLVGYVPTFSLAAIDDRLRKVSTRLGGIFGFFMGSRYVVFIDDFKTLKKAFGRPEFLAKPPLGAVAFSPDKLKTSVHEESDPKWRELKRFWQSSTRLIGANSHTFRTELDRVISQLVKELDTMQGKDVDVHWLLQHPLFNLGFSFSCGKTIERGSSILDMVHQHTRAAITFASFNMFKYMFPWLGKVLNWLPKRVTTNTSLEGLENVLSEEVREHERTLNPNDPRDFVDLFLIQMQKPGMEHIFNENTLISNCQSVLLGFTISICTTLEWFFVNMAANPDVQASIQEMIDLEVGREREPLLTDRSRMPLLDAAIMEAMRFRYFIPILGFRSVLKDTTLNGYDIPKDTLVLYNANCLFRCPTYWTEPDRFDPSRFLSDNGSTLQVPEQFIPYGVGKRTSLGESTSGPVMFLFAASLLQKFRILPPGDGINVDISCSLLNKSVHPVVKFQRRS